MYNLLKKMRKYYGYGAWMMLVEQAHARMRITDNEYEELKGMGE